MDHGVFKGGMKLGKTPGERKEEGGEVCAGLSDVCVVLWIEWLLDVDDLGRTKS